jgi:hypothetical protein
LSYHYAAIARQAAARQQLPAAASRLRKNLPPQTRLTLSQLDIRKKLSPAEADNIVLAESPQNGYTHAGFRASGWPKSESAAAAPMPIRSYLEVGFVRIAGGG